MPTPSHLKAIIGTLPTHAEMSQWNEEKFIHYFDLCKGFIERKGEQDRWRFTEDKVERANAYLDMKLESANSQKDWDMQEFAYRVNKAKPKEWFGRMIQFTRVVGGFLKRNPSYITERIYEAVQGCRPLDWGVTLHDAYKTKTGAEIIVAQNKETTLPQQTTIARKDSSLRLMDIQAQVIDLYYKLVKSVKPQDLKDLTTKEKLSLIKDFGFIFKLSSKAPVPSVFNQLNIVGANAQELEKAMLSYATKGKLESPG